MEIIKKWNKLFLLGIFAIVTTFSSEYVQSSPLDGSAELLDGTAELIKQWDSLNKIIDQARNSHVNNGRVDTTYCYLSGIQTTIAEMLAHQIETSLTYVPNAASYTDGFVSKQWLSYFYNLVDNRKKWKQGLTDNNLLAFYKGGLKVFYFFENNPIPMRAVENHVNRYIGRDWYGE